MNKLLRYVYHFFWFSLSILILTSCGTESTFKSLVMDISHNQIQIDVTDKFSKERKGKDIGYFLDIKVTKKTTVTDDTGNNIKLEEISIGDLVEVTLTEPISFHDPSALRNPVEAKYLILHNQ